MDNIGILLSIAVVQLLGAASPGPTFVIVSSASITGSRRLGLFAVCGVLLATLTWALLSAIGLGVVIARFPALYTALQVAGALYLIWLGVKMLVTALRRRDALANHQVLSMSAREAVRSGFLTNILNPKSIAYYSSIFVVMLPSHAPSWLFAAAVGTALCVSAIWWLTVALFFASDPIRKAYGRARRWIDAVMGAALIGLGVRLALSR
jgi:threonine efflux protein